MARPRGHIEHELMAPGSYLRYEALQTGPLGMHRTGRVRPRVCSVQLLHLRLFIYRCHVPPPVPVLRTAHAAPVWRGGNRCCDGSYDAANGICISAELY